MATTSQRKRGEAQQIPVSPELPTGAQWCGGWSKTLHLQLADGTYLKVRGLPPIAVARRDAVMTAIEQQPDEPSYSGTGTLYRRLTIRPPGDGDGTGPMLMAGDVEIGPFAIDPILGAVPVPVPVADDDQGEDEDDDDDQDDDNGN
jgi:hypothetical protein